MSGVKICIAGVLELANARVPGAYTHKHGIISASGFAAWQHDGVIPT
jgi:hypothetical protein